MSKKKKVANEIKRKFAEIGDLPKDAGVLHELLGGRPNNLLELALHIAEPFLHAGEETKLFVGSLDSVALGLGADCLVFLFSHSDASFPASLGLDVLGVLAAEGRPWRGTLASGHKPR